MIFETERLRVRYFHLQDGDNFFSINGSPVVMQYIRPPKSREDADKFLLEVIQYSSENPLYGRFAVEDRVTGEFVGSFSLLPLPQADQMHLGYALTPPHWGKGYASELTRHGLKYIFTKTPLEKIYAITETENTNSVKVLEKNRFKVDSYYEEGGRKMVKFVKQRGS